MKLNIKKNFKLCALIAALLVCLIAGSCMLMHNKQKAEEISVPEESVLVVDQNGKEVKDVAKVVPVTDTITREKTVREISYVEKKIDPVTKEKEKTDVEIKTEKKNVYVNINGKEHEIKPTVEENQKFENGKLVVEETSTSEIKITAPKPSKWTVSVYGNVKDHKIDGAGIGYAVSNTCRVDAMYINDMPYVGLTFAIGSSN